MTPTEIIELNLACALIGFVLGNRLAIDRDRRNEWNTLIGPHRKRLLTIIKNLSNFSLAGSWEVDSVLIGEYFPRRKRLAFDKAIEAYKQSQSTYSRNRKPDGGGCFVDGEKSAEDRVAISHAANDLLKFLKPK